MKQLYGQSWEKATFYDGLIFEGKVHMLGVRDPKEVRLAFSVLYENSRC